MSNLYDKSGGVFRVRYAVDDIVFANPAIILVDEETGDAVGEDWAEYLVERKRSELFDKPPTELVEAEISEKLKQLQALTVETFREKTAAENDLRKARAELDSAKRELSEWMRKHKIMMDLGKLLDGKTLYPLTVNENSYHRGPNIPVIPSMANARYLRLGGGNWETGNSWSCEAYGSDNYGQSFQFFDTEDERTAVISAQFSAACDLFRKKPDWTAETWTASTRMNWATLNAWINRHPHLSIPDDILQMKAANDAAQIAAKKAALAAELSAIDQA